MSLRSFVARSRVLAEDMILTAPRIGFVPRIASSQDWNLPTAVREVAERGCTSIGKVLSDAEIREIRSAIDEAVAGKRPEVGVKWNENVQYSRITNPLRLHPKLLELAAHPRTLAIAESYFRRAPYLADIDMRRIEPVSMESLGPKHVSSSNWHRDMRGRQLKLMIYLSPVGTDDSNFALIPGSHHGRHVRRVNYMDSRLADDEVRGMPTSEWFGQAGEGMLFDTNLIHRLRRKAGARVRDSITYYFTPGQSLFALDFDSGAIDRLPVESRYLFGEPGWPLCRMK